MLKIKQSIFKKVKWFSIPFVNMEELEGKYVFGQREGTFIALAPDLRAEILHEDNRLCWTKNCLLPDTISVTLRVADNVIVLENEQKESVSFVQGRFSYTLRGLRVYLHSSGTYVLPYVMTREKITPLTPFDVLARQESRLLSNTKKDIYAHVGETFTLSLTLQTGTGYTLNVIPSLGLEFVSKEESTCARPGCAKTITYTFQALMKGTLRVTIYKGQFWDKDSITSEERIVIVE